MSDEVDAANRERLAAARAEWDEAAARFDDEPDHGLRDPHLRAAWRMLLQAALPQAPGAVADLGCGTGSLSVLLAEMGCTVTAVDVSPAMIAQAERKARTLRRTIEFHVMDAADPNLAPQSFDAVLCRHLLWTLPAIDQVLERWARLLKPSGVLFLIEGRWHTGAGLRPQEIVAALPPSLTNAAVQPLSGRADLWGSPVDDERYAIRAVKSRT
jgi:ubiquinone/menaquinone biosynthesis C-methylase UbiE